MSNKRSGPKGQMTFYDACLQVLRESARAMTAKELCDEIMRQGLVVSHGATPAHTIRGRLYEKMKKGETSIKSYKEGALTYYYIANSKKQNFCESMISVQPRQGQERHEHEEPACKYEEDQLKQDQDHLLLHPCNQESNGTPEVQTEALVKLEENPTLVVDALLQLCNVSECGRIESQLQPTEEEEERSPKRRQGRRKRSFSMHMEEDQVQPPQDEEQDLGTQTTTTFYMCLRSRNKKPKTASPVAEPRKKQRKSRTREETASVASSLPSSSPEEQHDSTAVVLDSTVLLVQSDAIDSTSCSDTARIEHQQQTQLLQPPLFEEVGDNNSHLAWLTKRYRSSVCLNGLSLDEILDASYTCR